MSNGRLIINGRWYDWAKNVNMTFPRGKIVTKVEEKDTRPVCSEAQQHYESTGSACLCFLGHHPCSFCDLLTEEETEIYCSDGIDALKEYWRGLDEAPTKPSRPWWF